MENKEFYIDGIDVSGCSLYEDNPKYRMWGTCDCMRSMVDQSGYDELAGAECKGYNCYYKQLKRSEAQCEAMFVSHTDLEKKYKAKEQECERLKEEALHSDYGIMKNNLEGAITYLEKENKDLSKIIDCKNRTILTFKEQLDQLKAENEKLEQTLAEIKEIADKDFRHTAWEEYAKQLKQILQKISEVENERKENCN